MVVDTVMIQVQNSDASVYWLLLRHDNIHTVGKSTKPCKSEQYSHTSQHNTTAQRKKHLTFWAAQSSLIWLNVLHEPCAFFLLMLVILAENPPKIQQQHTVFLQHTGIQTKQKGAANPFQTAQTQMVKKVFIQYNYPVMPQRMIKVYYFNLYFQSHFFNVSQSSCFVLPVGFGLWMKTLQPPTEWCFSHVTCLASCA